MTMSDLEESMRRLECLKLAVNALGVTNPLVIETARKHADFVLADSPVGQDIPKITKP